MKITEFWGKAQPQHADSGPNWHPLVFHSLDVAAVGEILLEQHRGFRKSLPLLTGMAEDAAIKWIRCLLCLHDVGKFAMKFQAKVPELYPKCFDNNPSHLSRSFDHASGGMRLFETTSDIFGFPGGSRGIPAWRPLVSAVMGHHGTPPTLKFGVKETERSLRSDFGKPGLEAAKLFIRQVREFSAPPDIPPLERRQAIRASHAIAGFAVLADWIGSSQLWFPYREPGLELEAYWSDALANAQSAVTEAGILPATASSSLDYGDLLGVNAVPSPMQNWTASVQLPQGPALFLIEDETGSGKTEAALMLAYRLMKTGQADGLYIALPTMATTNAMFDRLAKAIRHIFTNDSAPTLALIHSARDIHPGFTSAILKGGRIEDSYSQTDDGGSETTASSTCAAWIADDRRRGFLADAGAGTIDQALLSVLPSRHQSLRLLGLMRRVLVLDEVHAYDAYMQREIETLLEFQAGLGGSAILLSATLPVSIRHRLFNAFEKGLGTDVHSSCVGTEYPLITVCESQGRTSRKVANQPSRTRRLPVRFLRSPEDALSAVKRATESGQAVLYIRNTVDDALDAYSKITTWDLEAQLFHARFALCDRLKIEKSVVKAFGKNSRPADRCRVLIATQVVEQSLDLDFDTLITDLAPIDLLIQRAGRLWRHDRPMRRGHPELLVVGPEAVNDADEAWFSRVFPRAAYVYRDHARLWLTARVLERAAVIDSPAGLRTLIEAVYDEDADTDCLPTALEGMFFEAEGRSGAERGVANTNVLGFSAGYIRDGGAWDTDVRTPTRLSDDPRVTLRLACIRHGRLEPYACTESSAERWHAWRLSEINVSARRVGGETIPATYEKAGQAAKAEWSRYDSEKILVVLEQSTPDGALMGSVRSGNDPVTTVQVCYDAKFGLRWI